MKQMVRIAKFIGLLIVMIADNVYGYEFGQEMGVSLHGVVAISQGDANMGTTDYVNYPYQCVQYVKRYYNERNTGQHVNLYHSNGIGVARNYYVGYDNPTYAYLRESGLARFANGGTVMPELGDILVYDDSSHSVGHVAIITHVGVTDYSVSNFCTTVETIEQNWSLNGRYTLSLTVSNGHYQIASRGTYSILGWLGLRKKDYHFQDSDCEGWDTGFDTIVAVQNQPDLHTWKVIAQGPNPGIVSPMIAGGYTCNQLSMLHFSYKVRGTVRDTSVQIWVRDQNGNWNHGVERFAVHVNYEYHHYAVDLSELGDTIITQFSIELTQNPTYEEWIFDWIELQSGTNESLDTTSRSPNYDGLGGGPEPEPTPTPIPTPTYPPDTSSTASIGQHVLCGRVQVEWPFQAYEVATSFYHTAPRIFGWLNLRDVNHRLRVRWDWYENHKSIKTLKQTKFTTLTNLYYNDRVN